MPFLNSLVKLVQSMRQRYLECLAANGAHARQLLTLPQCSDPVCDCLKGGGGGGGGVLEEISDKSIYHIK